VDVLILTWPKAIEDLLQVIRIPKPACEFDLEDYLVHGTQPGTRINLEHACCLQCLDAGLVLETKQSGVDPTQAILLETLDHRREGRAHRLIIADDSVEPTLDEFGQPLSTPPTITLDQINDHVQPDRPSSQPASFSAEGRPREAGFCENLGDRIFWKLAD